MYLNKLNSRQVKFTPKMTQFISVHFNCGLGFEAAVVFLLFPVSG